MSMNREIKFRGKRVDNGEWVYGGITSYLHSPTEDTQIVSCQHYEQHEDDEHYIFIDVLEGTIGQFTGLKDKSGVEIYEGDIIKTNLGIKKYISKNWNVVFEFGSFQLRNNNFENPLSFVFHAYEAIKYDYIKSQNEYTQHIEIIGNIHDNPELLNK